MPPLHLIFKQVSKFYFELALEYAFNFFFLNYLKIISKNEFYLSYFSQLILIIDLFLTKFASSSVFFKVSPFFFFNYDPLRSFPFFYFTFHRIFLFYFSQPVPSFTSISRLFFFDPYIKNTIDRITFSLVAANNIE